MRRVAAAGVLCFGCRGATMTRGPEIGARAVPRLVRPQKEASVGEEHNVDPPPEPQGHYAGVPYDWSRPTVARVRSRWWNRNDPRLFTPKSYGWGYDCNLYWLAHPAQYVRARRGS